VRYQADETVEMNTIPSYAKKGGLYYADVLGSYRVGDGVYKLSLWLKAEGFTGGAQIVLTARMGKPYELPLTLRDASPSEASRVFQGIQARSYMSAQKPVVTFNLRVNFNPSYADDGVIQFGFSLEGKSVKPI